MKPVEFSRKFEKAYANRIGNNSKLKTAYLERYKLFCAGVRGNPLYDHQLTKNIEGLRAFSITGDVRVIYRETEVRYEFIDIGSHNQVYH